MTIVTLSAGMIAKYMTILHLYVQNDYFWTHFNALGAQAFVADVFNRQLRNTTAPHDLGLFTIDASSEKDYPQSHTTVTVFNTDARRIAVEQLMDLRLAVAGLRRPKQRMPSRATVGLTLTTTNILLAKAKTTTFAATTQSFLTQVSDICGLNQDNSTIASCNVALVSAYTAFQAWPSASVPSIPTSLVSDILPLNISLMQYVSQNDLYSVLYKPLLDTKDPNWSFYGWLHLLDWLQGTREVVSFEGDANTFVLVSKQYEPDSFIADPLQTPTRFSNAIWLVMLCGASRGTHFSHCRTR
ncbi:Aste57867_12842 [Aphanomyces stellatus]|uniref:Aste57867_12842 protein n=1 Tax=Aphanomyces stellatus TaxID=120398 RepID=A0A485KWM3_9STRA|nr:hypothetical protein As57867_012794 [Aphanomyces stellatus]VFT89689.1 Aste57867_12842 [Aphanomyces stellatus]